MELIQDKSKSINRNIKNHCKTSQNLGINNKLTANDRDRLMQSFMKKIFEKLEEFQNKEQLLVIDRFEENIAVCENRETRKMINIDLSELPNELKEGDVIKKVNNKYELDEEKTAEIEERINEKVKDLFEE